MNHINFEQVQKQFGSGAARAVWNRLCDIGGFGRVEPAHTGGLDLTALDAKQKKEIEAVLNPPKGDK